MIPKTFFSKFESDFPEDRWLEARRPRDGLLSLPEDPRDDNTGVEDRCEEANAPRLCLSDEDNREDGLEFEVRWDEANIPRLGLLAEDSPEAEDRWEDASIPRDGLEPPRVEEDCDED